jgi:hypothetical protein
MMNVDVFFLDAMLCLTGDRFCLVVSLQVLPNWVNDIREKNKWFYEIDFFQ